MRRFRLLRPSQLQKRSPTPSRQFWSSTSLFRAFEDGDVVILRDKKDTLNDGILVTLRQGHSTHTHRGIIKNEDIIGLHPRQLVTSSKGSTYRIHEPTLADYVRLTPRLVTPIYPSDTNLIVSLLDIHVDTFGAALDTPPLEILEAGTGHGALTLHLSRAIHAANPPRPRTPPHACSQHDPEDAVYLGEAIADVHESSLDSWKASRRAIVHTLDISSKHSKHAEKIVQGFRGGMYAGNAEFHVGDVSDWIKSQSLLRNTDSPFLSHVFLDLPNADRHLANVAPALHVNGLLAVFNPSITQITKSVEVINEQRLPYLLDQVIELGAGSIRQWDVRPVKPRATLKRAEDPISSSDTGATDAEDVADQQEKWDMVCRPKIGERVVGGGFLGLWRRMEPGQRPERQDACARCSYNGPHQA